MKFVPIFVQIISQKFKIKMENGKQIPTDSTDLIITENKTKEINRSSLNTCK